jgi:hypothetical protein
MQTFGHRTGSIGAKSTSGLATIRSVMYALFITIKCFLSMEKRRLLHWGPPRGYWCIPFEHENQYTKRAVSHSNFANVCWSAAEAKALRVAIEAIEAGRAERARGHMYM